VAVEQVTKSNQDCGSVDDAGEPVGVNGTFVDFPSRVS
jgi:hypothetical protein